MFEQQSYDKATVQVESQPEPPLFKNYEIKSWEFSPVIYKILAASAVLHIAMLAFVAQTNILTMRGCDSPWVGSVCQVVDMAYVGAMLFGTEREFVDEAYENIDLGEADITFIDVTGETPPLSYPEGYFQIANPEQHQMRLQMAQNPDGTFQQSYTPTYTPPPTTGSVPDLMQIQPNPPAANPNAFKDDSGGSLFKVENSTPNNSGIATSRKGRGGKIRPGKNANAETEAPEGTVAEGNNNTGEPKPSASPTDKVEAVTINRKPMTDFADAVLMKWTENKVDFSKPFTIELNGFIKGDGKLDGQKSKWDPSKDSGDPAMIEIAKQSIESVSEAGWFGYLRNLNVDRFKLTLVQNENEIVAVVSSAQSTPERARMVSSGMNGLILGAKITARDPSDEKVLLEGASVTADGKNFVLNFKIPKPVALEMIDRNLKAAMARRQAQPQPSGAAATAAGNNAAIR